MNQLTSNPSTRESLLLRLRNPRDEEAWGEFAAIYEPVVYQLAKRRDLQDADAREVVQEVLISVTKSIDRFDLTKGSFRGWLSRVTRNAAVDLLRKRMRRPPADGLSAAGELAALASEEPDELATEFDIERRQQLFRWAAKEVRQRTGEKNWLAFWRTSVENRTVEKVASELGISEGAVYVAKCRVLKRIRKLVHERADD